ncbi:MAG: XdhC/CoxI family protein [Acidimicrobiales bacterium]|jgi:xanthine dehydrogenase accessory factor|nr:XdhC/CoxI family protein [Acidimicrobiales bacterium]MDP6285203.1 XdhC/CoxI family protein [Acidimicrobiales bacterium]HJL91150.1 XdhC/CoxI family protein [Acidimicrobiales bacterium]HJO41399.1 XdhC/CoxI family protein [Acidimicrobiales bacterium]|tara:strand:+ start:6413 stop:7216 length:804 start_codon:yes stop_codon:yes gene_type:complete
MDKKNLSKGMDETQILNELNSLVEDGKTVVLATVVETSRSVPRHSGAKMLILSDSHQVGTIGGGEMEARVIKEACACMDDGTSLLLNYELVDPVAGDPGVCGGTVTIHLETYMPNSKILIIGCGHVGRAVAELASWLGFHVVATDDREEIAESVTEADLVLTGSIEETLKQVNLTDRDHVVAVTRNAELDIQNLPHLLSTEAKSIGVMGSSRRWETTRSSLESAGVSEEDLSRITSPIGLDLNAETPQEIALSILSQIIEQDNAGNN